MNDGTEERSAAEQLVIPAIGRRLFRVVCAAAVLLACACFLQAPSSPPASNARVGCYRFNQSFFVGSHYDSTVRYATIDSTAVVRLLADTALRRVRRRFPDARTLTLPEVRTHSGLGEDYARESFWHSFASDSLMLYWGGMTSGRYFKLAVRGNTLVGVQSYRSDLDGHLVRHGDTTFVEFNEPKYFPVNAVRISCPPAIVE